MLLDVQRFRDSDLVVLEKPEAVLAAVLLWGASWHQVPAASLPDDDRMLAQLAGYGRSVPAWKKVKAGALRGFIKCSDGRLYHPVVADKARGMWEDKLKRRHGMLCAAIRKHNERKHGQLDTPTFDDWLKLGRPEKVADLLCAMPKRHADKSEMSHGQAAPVTQEIGSNRTELNRTELNSKPKPSPTLNESIPKPKLRATDCFNEVCAAARWHPRTDTQRADNLSVLEGWLACGCSLDLIVGAIQRALARKPGEITKSLRRFDSTVRGMRSDELGGELPHTPADVQAIASTTAKRLAAGG